MPEDHKNTHVVVLGAGKLFDVLYRWSSVNHLVHQGVIGLTTALKIKEQGYNVTIVAEILPTDPKTIRYTSHWAVKSSTDLSVHPS